MSEIYGLATLCVLFVLVAFWIYANSKKRVDMTRLERLDKLKKYFLHELVEDSNDGTNFDCSVLDAFEFLEKRYKDE